MGRAESSGCGTMPTMAGAGLSDAAIRDLYELRNDVDELIEQGLVHRWSVAEVLGAILPKISERLGATAAFVETYHEDLSLRLFTWSVASGQPLVIPEKGDVYDRTSEEKRDRVILTTQQQGEPLVVA